MSKDKIQIIKKTTQLKKIEVEFPIYSYIEEGAVSYYFKLEKEWFNQIKITHCKNEVCEITRYKSNNMIVSELYIDNPTSKDSYDKACFAASELISLMYVS